VSGRERRVVLSGWGRAAPSAASIERPTSPKGLVAILERAARERRRVAARGLGRSYGDAAQCAGGIVVDCTGLDQVLELDLGRRRIRVRAGASLDALLRLLVPKGLFLPVTPGTRHVTVGGAIAADVHGKNHHRDGSFGAHVEELVLVSPTGRHVASRAADPELLTATLGGLGLTGIVEEATFSLVPIATSRLVVDTERARDLEDLLARMAERDDEYRYSVAWLDCLARGRHLGRGVLTRADHAAREALGVGRRDPLAYDPRTRVSVPFPAPARLLNEVSVAAFNEAWYRRAPRVRRGELQSIPRFFHPLDGVGRWNLLYGRSGFTQYQFVVPFGAEEALRRVVERLASARVPSFLAVLKRFGPSGEGHLSFPTPGWTLALDLPLGRPGLAALLDDLDEVVAEAGGRVYLAKDGRLRPDLIASMYPRLESWRTLRRRVDPDGVLATDLARRLGLVP